MDKEGRFFANRVIPFSSPGRGFGRLGSEGAKRKSSSSFARWSVLSSLRNIRTKRGTRSCDAAKGNLTKRRPGLSLKLENRIGRIQGRCQHKIIKCRSVSDDRLQKPRHPTTPLQISICRPWRRRRRRRSEGQEAGLVS